MNDERKTKKDLIAEMEALRQQVAMEEATNASARKCWRCGRARTK